MIATPDINLHSFNGPHFNGQVVRMLEEIRPGAEISDTLKCSTQLTDFIGLFGTVYAGREDVCDVNNRCDGIDMRANLWVLTGSKYGFTIKGGSHGVRLGGRVTGHGRECDVDLGNWSDQSTAKTTGTVLDLTSVDGSPIRVRCLNAERPYLVPGSGPYEWVFPAPNIYFHDFFVSAFYLVRGLLK